MSSNIRQEIKDLIIKGEFLKTRKLLQQLPQTTLQDLIFIIGNDEQNICAYSFVCFLLQENESVEWHCFASELLNVAFCYLKGAYQTSLHHIQKAIELSPEDVELKEALLFLNIIPEKVLSNEEAIKIAHQVLQKKPESSPAKRVLKEANKPK